MNFYYCKLNKEGENKHPQYQGFTFKIMDDIDTSFFATKNDKIILFDLENMQLIRVKRK